MDNLIQIRIENLPNCSRLPSLGVLPRLTLLELGKLAMLEYVMENEVEGGGQVKDSILFPSLEKLKLWSLPDLKGLLKHEEEVRELFPNLQQLFIQDSPMLILPPLSSLKELNAHHCSSLNVNSLSKLGNLTYLSIRFDNDMRTCITKDTLENLSKLEKLVLENAKEYNLPIETLIQGLKSLTELNIYNCDALTCLSDGWLRHLTALDKLIIANCKELVELFQTEGMVPSLKSLYLCNLPQLTSLLVSLGNVTSFQLLVIRTCPQLISLPASIKGMTNLERLKIDGCPELEMRCEKEKGEDWHIIAHVPKLVIGNSIY